MDIAHYIQAIQIHLVQTHARLFDWFTAAAVKNYRPGDQGWTIREILEHISLTNHYLLILIDKAADKALRNVHDRSLEEELHNFDYDLDRLTAIGTHKSFDWIRPEHMEPTGEKSDLEIMQTLTDQLRRCLNHLSDLGNGEGLLYQTTMTVHDLGKLNVYEYIYFLSKHAERHIAQMRENKEEYGEQLIVQDSDVFCHPVRTTKNTRILIK